MAKTQSTTLRPRKGQGRVDELKHDREIVERSSDLLRIVLDKHQALVGADLEMLETFLGKIQRKLRDAEVEAMAAVAGEVPVAEPVSQ